MNSTAARLATLFTLTLLLLGFPAGCQPTKPSDLTTGTSKWWKGNWHAHSYGSDGDSYPEMVVKWYANHGYNFLILTDHIEQQLPPQPQWVNLIDPKTKGENFKAYQACFGDRWVQTRTENGVRQVRVRPLDEYRHLFERPGRFMLLSGEEITMDGYTHVNAFNIAEPIPAPNGNTVVERVRAAMGEVAQQSQKTGRIILAQVNHPNWYYAVTAEDIAPMPEVKFLEVYNCFDVSANNAGDNQHVSTERLWDIVLTKRLAELNLPIIYGTTGDDAHFFLTWGPKKSNPGRGWVMVRAAALTSESIMQAVQTGDFYFSTGVELKTLDFDGRTINIDVKPQFGVQYTIEFIGTRRGYDPTSKPMLDEKGNEIPTTRIYSDQIGCVLAQTRGAKASYTFTGDEIYVRARVLSSKPMTHPTLTFDKQAAWTQPVLPSATKN